MLDNGTSVSSRSEWLYDKDSYIALPILAVILSFYLVVFIAAVWATVGRHNAFSRAQRVITLFVYVYLASSPEQELGTPTNANELVLQLRTPADAFHSVDGPSYSFEESIQL
jgi:hypothetical protein